MTNHEQWESFATTLEEQSEGISLIYPIPVNKTTGMVVQINRRAQFRGTHDPIQDDPNVIDVCPNGKSLYPEVSINDVWRTSSRHASLLFSEGLLRAVQTDSHWMIEWLPISGQKHLDWHEEAKARLRKDDSS